MVGTQEAKQKALIWKAKSGCGVGSGVPSVARVQPRPGPVPGMAGSNEHKGRTGFTLTCSEVEGYGPSGRSGRPCAGLEVVYLCRVHKYIT